jgi:NAD(P)-dependent dehydrogenase (short-subunit alcohol dehydrogenase family)
VAITARTVIEGEGRDHSEAGSGREIPGSLETTSRDVEEMGRRCLPIPADLHDRLSLTRAVDKVIDNWGGIDLLVNNAVDTGPGSMIPIKDLDIDLLESKLDSNVVAQFVLIKAVLPAMLNQGAGTIINVTSHTAVGIPPGPIGQGGWGLAYAASKAAFHKIAQLLAVELGAEGLRAFNLDPGYVDTERQQLNAEALGLAHHYVGAPPSVPASVIAWLAEDPSRAANGETLKAQRFALAHGIHADWRTP